MRCGLKRKKRCMTGCTSVETEAIPKARRQSSARLESKEGAQGACFQVYEEK